VFGFLKSLFMSQPSSETAKDRLRVVLLADHLSLSPEVVDALRSDLLAVIRRYVEIDEENVDLTFEQREKEVAMLASVPILSVKGSISSEHDSRRSPEMEHTDALPLAAVEAESTEFAEEEEEVQPLEEEPTAMVEGRRRRRRRRPLEPEPEPLASTSAGAASPIGQVQSL
jgi:cell division topological specificity factor